MMVQLQADSTKKYTNIVISKDLFNLTALQVSWDTKVLPSSPIVSRKAAALDWL